MIGRWLRFCFLLALHCSAEELVGPNQANVSAIDLARQSLANDKVQLEAVLQQIRVAFTAAQYEEALHKIRTSPHGIITDASSPLQVQAARLMLKIWDESNFINGEETRLQNEQEIASRAKMLQIALGMENRSLDLKNPRIEAIGNIAILKKRIDELFDEYLNQTSFFTRTRSEWMGYYFLERNVLSNENSRFLFTLNKIWEYWSFVKEQNENDRTGEDMQHDILLRHAALKAYEARIREIDRLRQDVDSAFDAFFVDDSGDARSCKAAYSEEAEQELQSKV